LNQILGGNIRNIYILLLLSLSFGTVTDIDGNVYETVQIGEQLWMAENLKVTHYSNGSGVAYLNYEDNPNNSETYGHLYNWNIINSGQICPQDWHVPSDDEWTFLSDYLGGVEIAGDKMKEAGLEHWDSANEGATNESGFTALPAGLLNFPLIIYEHMGYAGYFWSSTASDAIYPSAWGRKLTRDSSELFGGEF